MAKDARFVRLRQFPQFATQMVQRSLLLRSKPRRTPVFRLCYFSCQSYFAYLYCAIHSLDIAAPGLPIEITVFSDTDQPLSDDQIAVLQQLRPGLRVIPWPKSMGWGSVQIGHIWDAYALVAETADDDDIIARIDSDVFFFNDRIFQAVARSKADFVGDGHFIDFLFCQGGAYFFRAGAVRRIVQLVKSIDLAAELERDHITVEDMAAHYFARRLGISVQMVYFMMFPDEYRNAGSLTPWQRWKFSCLHFVMKNKAAMLVAYRHEVLPAAQHAEFDRLLTTA